MNLVGLGVAGLGPPLALILGQLTHLGTHGGARVAVATAVA